MTAGPVSRSGEVARVAGNRSTRRVLQVFSRLAGYQRYVGVTELSRDLGMTKNMVHRALSTLVEQGYVVRDADGLLYSIGPGVINFQSREPLEVDVRAMCRPYLQELHALTGESVFFSIIVGRMRVNTDGIEAQGPRITHVNRGRPLPLHITATGRVLLASLTDVQIRQ
jgi:DNA-binding IclR family transcriptional regulator